MCEKMQNANSFIGACGMLKSHLVAAGTVNQVSAQFAALTGNCNRVDYVYRLLEKFGLFPDPKVCRKDVKVAQQLRQEGNLWFKKKNDGKALLKYTESLAYAEENSEDLALAFANRSAVLYERGFYKECLEDIGCALSNNYPQQLHQKLDQRKQKAEALLHNQKHVNYHEALPGLSYEPNSLIQCAGNCVQVKCEEQMGRHVVATRNIEVGDVVAIEQPFAKILLRENYLTHCYHCLEPCVNLVPCKGCPLVMFCSQQCLQESACYHRHECPISDSLLSLGINKLTLVALRICILAEEPFGVIGSVYRSDRYAEIHHLIANTDLRPASDLFERSVTAAMVFRVFSQTGFFESRSEQDFKERLLLHMQTGPSNFHEISELVKKDSYELEEVGAGAFSFLSLLNHSCCPNVVRHCYGSAIVLRALRPVAEGEQLFDNYGYHHAVMEKAERQQHLKQQYYFSCICEACQEDWPLYHDLPLKNSDSPVTEEQLDELKGGNVDVAKEVLPALRKIAGSLESLRPCREMADVQEIMKQCFAILGNKRVPMF